MVAHTHTHKRQSVEVTALPNPLSGILCKRLLGRLTQQGPRMGGLVKRWSVAIDFFACGAPDVRRAVRSDSSCRRVRDVPPLGVRDNGKKSSLAAAGEVYGGPRLLRKPLGSLENGLGSHYSHAGCDPELWTSSPKLSYTWQSCGPLRKRNTQANVHPNGTVHRDIVRPVKSSIVSRQPVGARNCTVVARQSLSSLPISAAHCRSMRWHAL